LPVPACAHCFTGTEAEARAYVALGLYVGFTGTACMPRRGAPLRALLRAGAVPLDRILLETDAPFMHPGSEDKALRAAAQAREDAERAKRQQQQQPQASGGGDSGKKKKKKKKPRRAQLRCLPEHVRDVARTVAACLGVGEDEVMRRTTANARRFFGDRFGLEAVPLLQNALDD